MTFWRSFENGVRNKWVDIRYIYINGGPFNGWRTWSNVDGGRAINYIIESKKLGMIPFFVYYNIPDGGESYFTDKQHVEDANYLQAYYKDLKFFLDIVRTYGGDEVVGIVLEPDFLGYMMQNSNGTNPLPASKLLAKVSAAYASGVLDANVDPLFPETIQGLVQSINYMISKFAPNARFGWQFNLWASPGITTNIPGNGLMHKTDTLGITEGRKVIASEAWLIAQYYKDAGVGSHGAHFVSIDKYGLDAGISSPQNPAQSIWFWHADHWNNYLLFAATLRNSVSLPVILWQLPVGRINTSQQKDPYNGNALFPVLNNTHQRYEDSASTFFFGDSFKPGSDIRYQYFKTNAFADAKISATADTVTWKSHMLDAKKSGIIALLFGPGVGDSTQNIGTPPTDNYWWITKAQNYFTNPIALN